MRKSRAHLVLDSERKNYHSVLKRLEASRERLKKAGDEAIANEKAAIAPDGDHPTTILQAQIGRPLAAHVVMDNLKRLNRNLVFEVSHVTGKIGIYWSDGMTKNYLGICMEPEINPEFSVRVEKDGKFLKEIRGYRTVLQRLIRSGHITLSGVEKLFGMPSRSSKNWQVLTT